MPTLAEVLWAFPAMPVMIEVKEPAVQEAVRRVLVEEQACDRCLVASEHAEALQLFREEPFACGASGEEISELYWSSLLRRRKPAPRYRALSVPLRYRGLPVPTRPFVSAARRLGCPVHVWTVNSAADRAAALGAGRGGDRDQRAGCDQGGAGVVRS